MNRNDVVILDGPLGTQLLERGIATELPLWSAVANQSHPDTVTQIHRDYASAGATVHTANTFRTKRRDVGDDWHAWTAAAISLARQAVPEDHLVAGSLSPLADCYQPDASPMHADWRACRDEHREMANALAELRCDWILCETFPLISEALLAVDASVRTGLPTMVGFTAGPDGSLLSPAEMALAARQAVDAGAAGVLVNCTPATETLRFIEAIASEKLGLPIGAYANAGHVDERIGWISPSSADAATAVNNYVHLAGQWVDAGATMVGGCCGTTPAHIEGLRRLLRLSP